MTVAPTNGGTTPSPAALWPLARLFGVLVEIAGAAAEGPRTPSAAADAGEDPPRHRPPERGNATERAG